MKELFHLRFQMSTSEATEPPRKLARQDALPPETTPPQIYQQPEDTVQSHDTEALIHGLESTPQEPHFETPKGSPSEEVNETDFITSHDTTSEDPLYTTADPDSEGWIRFYNSK